MKFLKKSFPVLVFVTVVLAVSCSNNSSKSSSSGSGSGSSSGSTDNSAVTRYEWGTSLQGYSKIYSYTYQGPITDANGTHNVTRTYRIGIARAGAVRCVVSEGAEKWNILEAELLNTGPDGGNIYFKRYTREGYYIGLLNGTTDSKDINIKFSQAEAEKFMCDSYSVYENPYDTSSRRIAYFPGIALANIPGTVVFNRD